MSQDIWNIPVVNDACEVVDDSCKHVTMWYMREAPHEIWHLFVGRPATVYFKDQCA